MAKQLKEIEIPFGAKDSELYGWEYTIPEGMEATIVDNKIVVNKKESEDEKVRKTLIKFFEDWGKTKSHCWGVPLPKILSWIEAQGEHANFRNAIQVGDKVTRNEDGVVVNLSQLNRVAKKQGEQKPDTDLSDLRTWKYIADYVLTKWCGIGQYLDNPYLTTIAENLQKKYYLEQKQGEQKPAEYTLEQAAGIFLDALSNTPYNNKPITDAQVITKELLKFLSNASSYNSNALNEQKPADTEKGTNGNDREIPILEPPLTIKHAKEVMGIKEDDAWSEGDEVGLCDALWAIQKARTIAKDENDMGNLWYAEQFLNSIKDRVQSQPKQRWSEEDEETIDFTIAVLKENLPNGYFKTNPINTLNMGGIHTDELIKKLKFLKEKYTWKPSDEHYELEEFAKIVRCNLTGISKAVQELFEAKYLQLTGNKMYGGYKD